MVLHKSVGNMYNFCDATINYIKGKCPHNCDYCYIKRFPIVPLRFDDKELKTKLGTGKTIFVGSSCDMWAEAIPGEWILKVLNKCKEYDNIYVFQTKNPRRFIEFKDKFPQKVILGVTLETNELGFNYNAPNVKERAYWFSELNLPNFKRFVTIEPIIDFSIEQFVELIKFANPQFVNIGADSKNHHLPEPSKEEIEALIKELSKFTIVKIKDNLKRLL